MCSSARPVDPRTTARGAAGRRSNIPNEPRPTGLLRRNATLSRSIVAPLTRKSAAIIPGSNSQIAFPDILASEAPYPTIQGRTSAPSNQAYSYTQPYSSTNVNRSSRESQESRGSRGSSDGLRASGGPGIAWTLEFRKMKILWFPRIYGISTQKWLVSASFFSKSR